MSTAAASSPRCAPSAVPSGRVQRQATRCRSRQAAWLVCRGTHGPDGSATASGGAPPPVQQEQQAPMARRGVLALVAAAAATAGQGSSPLLPQTAVAAAAAAPAQAGAPAAAPVPMVVPPLTETYVSNEGFAFNYPAGWVVAFDRSGSSGNGAVIVVGDFRQLVTVSVFRTETIPESVVRQGLTEESGASICVEPQQRQDSTMRFDLLRSAVVPPAPGSSPPGSAGGAGGPAYEFEFAVESCAGEIEEGMGGRLRCLSFGAVIPSQKRRHIGRCVLANGRAYSLNASSPEDRWAQVGPVVQAVVSTFRS